MTGVAKYLKIQYSIFNVQYPIFKSYKKSRVGDGNSNLSAKSGEKWGAFPFPGPNGKCLRSKIPHPWADDGMSSSRTAKTEGSPRLCVSAGKGIGDLGSERKGVTAVFRAEARRSFRWAMRRDDAPPSLKSWISCNSCPSLLHIHPKTGPLLIPAGSGHLNFKSMKWGCARRNVLWFGSCERNTTRWVKRKSRRQLSMGFIRSAPWKILGWMARG